MRDIGGARLLVGLLAAAIVTPAGAQVEQPTIQLSHSNWDFGSIWHPETTNFTLIVSNVGMGPLKILRVQASCGCTAAQPAAYDLAPGEETQVQVAFDSRGKQGKQHSTVTIYSNDPRQPEMQFQITGEVKRAVIVEPMGGVVIRGLDPLARLTAKARVKNQESTPMKLRVISQSTEQFDVQIAEVVPDKEWEITATTRPPLGFGSNRGTITLETGIAREPTVTVPVTARIIERVNLVPPAFLFVREDPKPARRGLDIEYYGTGDFRIEKVVCRDPNFKFTVAPPRGPAKWQIDLPPTPKTIVAITVDVPPAGQIPADGVELEIFTNDPDYPRLAVMFTTQSDVFNRLSHPQPKPPQPPPPPSSAPATQPVREVIP